MLDFCRSKTYCHSVVHYGFTLIEIVVVLLVLGLVSGIAIPRLTALFDSLQTKNQLAEIHQTIRSAPLEAYLAGKSLDLSEHLVESKVIPSGWTFSFPEPVIVKANGVCQGGEIHLQMDSIIRHFKISSPLCQIDDV